MAPRAAARLETLGFTDVYEYKAGKLDWMAAGLPTEGENSLHPRAGDASRKDVPVCGLTDRLGDVAERVKAAGWDAAVVVDEDRVVLGLLRSKELAQDADLRIEDAMRPGPSTSRPYVSLHEMAHFMEEHKLDSSLVTTSDGKLVGMLYKADAMRLGTQPK